MFLFHRPAISVRCTIKPFVLPGSIMRRRRRRRRRRQYQNTILRHDNSVCMYQNPSSMHRQIKHEKDAKEYRLIKGFEELASKFHTGQSSNECGDCGASYQACCLAFQIEGDPCDCSLTSPGSGVVGPNCGDCGVEYGACCIGFDAAGYPCNCDIFP